MIVLILLEFKPQMFNEICIHNVLRPAVKIKFEKHTTIKTIIVLESVPMLEYCLKKFKMPSFFV